MGRKSYTVIRYRCAECHKEFDEKPDAIACYDKHWERTKMIQSSMECKMFLIG